MAVSADTVQSGGLASCSIQPQTVSLAGTKPESDNEFETDEKRVGGGGGGRRVGRLRFGPWRPASTKIRRCIACMLGGPHSVCVGGRGSA